MTQAEEHDLEALRRALVFGLRVELPPENPGDAAFERHLLLAVRFHRASRLNAPNVDRDGRAWQQYFDEHFPRGGEHAHRLWVDWRVRLLKDEHPGERVAVSHGQPRFHWTVDPQDRLYINLESMWDDFERSVDHLLDLLRSNDERRRKTLEAFRARQWSVQQFVLEEPTFSGTASMSVLSVASVTGRHPPEPPQKKPRRNP